MRKALVAATFAAIILVGITNLFGNQSPPTPGIPQRVQALEARVAALETRATGGNALDLQALVGTWTGSRFFDPGFNFATVGNITAHPGESFTFRADGTGTSTMNNLETNYMVAGRSVLFGKYLLMDAHVSNDILTFVTVNRAIFAPFPVPGGTPGVQVGQPALYVLHRQP